MKGGRVSPHSFTEEDKKKLIEYLNFVGVNATFTLKTEDVIKYFSLLSHMQKAILPKVDAHILEIKQIVDAPPEPKETKKSRGA